MEIISNIIPKGKANRPGKAMIPLYITIHETGNYSAGAKSHGNYLKNTTAKVSWHYTVDDNCAVQHLPTSETAYHAGDGANGRGNTKSIGIEICVNADGDFSKACENTAELVRKLMKAHNIPIENVVQHNRWNGKNCPQRLRQSGWADFIKMCKAEPKEEIEMTKADVIAIIEEYEKNKAKQTVSPWAKESFEKATKAGILDGSNPRGNVSREMLATVLHRLGFFR